MSSLAASRADNFYFPPEWRPEYGGISKFAGSKGANQYEQYGIIRFEMPMDTWCLGCNIHMTKGLRFNAKKDKKGKYFSTQIYAFTMKCFECSTQFIIETDPENGTYKFVEGIRKHEQDFAPDFDDSLIQLETDEQHQKLEVDPMYKLQHQHEEKKRVLNDSERFKALEDLNDTILKPDYDMNCLLRNKNRKRRKNDQRQLEDGKKRGLSIPLLDTNGDDLKAALKANYHHNHQKMAKSIENQTKLNNQTNSIFSKSNKNTSLKTDSSQVRHEIKSKNFKIFNRLEMKDEIKPIPIKINPKKFIKDKSAPEKTILSEKVSSEHHIPELDLDYSSN